MDARVEDEWDSIYVDCQDGADVDLQDFSFDGSGDLLGSLGSTGSSGVGVGSARGRDAGGVAATAAAAAAASSRREGGRWRASSSSSSSSSASVSTGGSRSALMAAMDAYQAEDEQDDDEEEEDEEDGQESGDEGEGRSANKGFDEEDIIDCAIRGRWTFKNNDDPVRRARASAAAVLRAACLVLLWVG